MKKWLFIIGTAATTVWLTGCSSSYFAAAGYGNDDLYAIHDKAEIARRQQAEAEKKKAEAEARRAEWEARLAEAEANAVQRRYYETTSNPYEDVLADTYESAYARRLRGFESPTYRMPSSYYDFRYGSSFHYVSAYDPAFYNVMVMGDQVWVSPNTSPPCSARGAARRSTWTRGTTAGTGVPISAGDSRSAAGAGVSDLGTTRGTIRAGVMAGDGGTLSLIHI